MGRVRHRGHVSDFSCSTALFKFCGRAGPELKKISDSMAPADTSGIHQATFRGLASNQADRQHSLCQISLQEEVSRC